MLTRLSIENEYLRRRTNSKASRRLISPSELATFVDRPIRVPVEPTERPLIRFDGFWLRTLEPPGYTDCEPKILSRREQSEADKVCLGDAEWGTTGTVYFEPKVKSDRRRGMGEEGWSKIRWIKLGFDKEFNPILLLANERPQTMHSTRRFISNENLFRQAITSEAGSQTCSELFDNLWLRAQAYVPSKSYGWYGEISVLKVDRRRGVSGSLEALNLGISIKLCPTSSCKILSSEGIGEKPEQIWVVDITDTKGSDPERALTRANIDLHAEECVDMLFCCGACSMYCSGPSRVVEASR